MESLIVYENKYKKIRLGSDNDGGYVISILPKGYDCFISCGISNDINFEIDFINLYNIKCYAFDGTIDKTPKINDMILFNKINIGTQNTDNTTNLKELINKYENIMLKMDIETYEFRWFDILTNDELKRIKQMVIEFHNPFQDYSFPTGLDIPTTSEFKMNILKKIAETHYLIHFHPNTAACTRLYNNFEVPDVFECKYVRKDCQEDIGYNHTPIPHPLDMKNSETDREITLNGYPFCIR
jgi:hypothetical protein